MAYTYIFGNNNLAELLYFYLVEANVSVDGFVLNQAYVNNNIKDLPGRLYAIEEIIDKYGVDNIEVYVAVGYMNMNAIREKVFDWLVEKGIRIRTYIHPSAEIASNVRLGEGNIILEGAVIQPYVYIGNGNILWEGAMISHHCQVGNFNYFAPGVVVSGRVNILERCFFGSNSTIANDVTIETEVLVGAGAYVYKGLKRQEVFVPHRGQVIEKRSDQIVLQ